MTIHYFVTICTRNRECLFGDIIAGEMRLNDAGKMVNQCWIDIPIHFPDVKLDQFVIMPNHVHGILTIVNPRRGTACRAPTGRTTWWQRNYYEHIIRNEESLARIRKYIANNPENWDSDDENPTIGFIFNMTRTHIIPEKEICWIPVFFVESKFGIFNLRPK